MEDAGEIALIDVTQSVKKQKEPINNIVTEIENAMPIDRRVKKHTKTALESNKEKNSSIIRHAAIVYIAMEYTVHPFLNFVLFYHR